jgi:serine/threonine protein kinase
MYTAPEGQGRSVRPTRSMDVPRTRHPDATRGAEQSLGVEAGFDASSATRFEELAAAELGGFVEDPRLVSGLGPWVQLSAREPLSQERVAVWIRPRSRLPERATRDVLEAAKRLRSSPLPTVVPLRRFGCTDELLWLIGPELPGSTLSEWFGRGSAPSVEGVKTFLGLVLPPLQTIHEAGFAHGALSAEAFHRDSDGVIRVCRPGIDVPILRADLAAGTRSAAVTYAPPEVRAGGDPTPASDQYALAAAVLWMLTGHAPEPEGQEIASMPSAVPRGWQPILCRALDPTPARRGRPRVSRHVPPLTRRTSRRPSEDAPSSPRPRLRKTSEKSSSLTLRGNHR